MPEQMIALPRSHRERISTGWQLELPTPAPVDTLRRVAGSFRDPSGFVFRRDDCLYRQINPHYQRHYDRLMDSGLYEELAGERMLIPHREADTSLAATDEAYKVIEPQPVPFISYPYEWCFSQLKDAALLTLAIQKRALAHGMTLKDCSAYNVQFWRGKPIFIDTTSFEIHEKGSPWVAYRQFCQHFLAPLALMARRDIRLGQLLKIHIDGVPLDLAASLLGWRGNLSPAMLLHVKLHARLQASYQNKPVHREGRKISDLARAGLIDSLERAIRKLSWKPAATEWGEYYSFTNYTDSALEAKKEIVSDMLAEAGATTVWDLGANTGIFSRLAAGKGISTVSLDGDPAAVEKNYLHVRQNNEADIMPLLVDLSNPSGSIGWANQERSSLNERGPADTVMALALIHHLAISNNTPLPMLAEFFSTMGKSLIIEFVPKSDSQVQRLLASREDVFPNYDQASFESAFARYFNIKQRRPVPDTQRTLYLMSKRSD